MTTTLVTDPARSYEDAVVPRTWSKMPLSAPVYVWGGYLVLLGLVAVAVASYHSPLDGVLAVAACAVFSFQMWTFAAWRGLVTSPAALSARSDYQTVLERSKEAEAALSRVRQVLDVPLLHTSDPERAGERYLARRVQAALTTPTHTPSTSATEDPNA